MTASCNWKGERPGHHPSEDNLNLHREIFSQVNEMRLKPRECLVSSYKGKKLAKLINSQKKQTKIGLADWRALKEFTARQEKPARQKIEAKS